MSSVTDVTVDGISTANIEVYYNVHSVGDFVVDGLSSVSVEVYFTSGVGDFPVDGIVYTYVDVVEQVEGQPVQVSGVSTWWYILAFVALVVLDLLLSGRRRR